MRQLRQGLRGTEPAPGRSGRDERLPWRQSRGVPCGDLRRPERPLTESIIPPGRAVRVSLRVRWTAALLAVALVPLAALAVVTLRKTAQARPKAVAAMRDQTWSGAQALKAARAVSFAATRKAMTLSTGMTSFVLSLSANLPSVSSWRMASRSGSGAAALIAP